MTRRTLVARLDNVGDVLLTGPAVRAVASVDGPITFLAGPSGVDAATLLPGVADVIVFDAPWVAYAPPHFDNAAMLTLLGQIESRRIERALILTSFHQSPLPLALLLRMAGVRFVAATSVDYPGSLLDVRQAYIDELHEVEQALALAAAAGYPPPPDDTLRIGRDDGGVPTIASPFVVVHPGASVAARALPRAAACGLVEELTFAGVDVVLTGGARERGVSSEIAAAGMPGRVVDLTGETSLAELAGVIAAAHVVVCGNTAAAHVAAAVGTPVVQAFAPTVPSHRWRPWRVPHVLLGSLDIGCAGCRSRQCPVRGQPCLSPFTVAAALNAVRTFLPAPTRLDAEVALP